MIKVKIITLLILFPTFAIGQKSLDFEAINKEIWQPFSEAYQNHDVALYASIHSENFIRINANTKSIKDKPTYIAQYEQNWKNDHRKLDRQFRFIERIATNNKASEIGIYKLTVTEGNNSPRSFYGKFHVILIKEERWKILVDYDSDEFGTIGEVDFQKAFDINTF